MGQRNIQLINSNHNISKRDTLARLISDLANPLFLPPIVFFFLGWQLTVSQDLLWLQTGIAAFFYSIIPLCITLFFLKKGYISSLDVPERQTRNKLFIFITLSSSAGSLILIALFYNSHPFLANIAIIYLINPFLGILINLGWKISIHTGSLAIASTIFCFFFITHYTISPVTALVLSLGTLLLLLPMIWARLHLGIHTIYELMGGVVAGLILTSVELSLIF